MVQTIHTGQVSTFPLFPLTQQPGRDYGAGFYASKESWRTSHTTNVRQFLREIHSNALEERGLLTAAERFLVAFRFSDHFENVIDLLVCLEALLGVSGNELRYTLASRAAALLGHDDATKISVYKHVSCAYSVRNALVHARTNPGRDIRKYLTAALPTLDLPPGTKDALGLLVLAIRDYARVMLQARVIAGDSWPRDDAWDTLVMDSTALRKLRRQTSLLDYRPPYTGRRVQG